VITVIYVSYIFVSLVYLRTYKQLSHTVIMLQFLVNVNTTSAFLSKDV